MGKKKAPLTYAGVGIDLERRRATVERYREVTKGATRPEVLSGVGPFGGLFALGEKYRDPVLVSSTRISRPVISAKESCSLCA